LHLPVDALVGGEHLEARLHAVLLVHVLLQQALLGVGFSAKCALDLHVPVDCVDVAVEAASLGELAVANLAAVLLVVEELVEGAGVVAGVGLRGGCGVLPRLGVGGWRRRVVLRGRGAAAPRLHVLEGVDGSGSRLGGEDVGGRSRGGRDTAGCYKLRDEGVIFLDVQKGKVLLPKKGLERLCCWDGTGEIGQ